MILLGYIILMLIIIVIQILITLLDNIVLISMPPNFNILYILKNTILYILFNITHMSRYWH